MSQPLSKDELWKIYTDKNPHWLTDGAKLAPEGLKRFFEQTFELGRKHGEANAVRLVSGYQGVVNDLRNYLHPNLNREE